VGYSQFGEQLDRGCEEEEPCGVHIEETELLAGVVVFLQWDNGGNDVLVPKGRENKESNLTK